MNAYSNGSKSHLMTEPEPVRSRHRPRLEHIKTRSHSAVPCGSTHDSWLDEGPKQLGHRSRCHIYSSSRRWRVQVERITDSHRPDLDTSAIGVAPLVR